MIPCLRRRPMADVEVHPSAEELAAFTHGTLDGASLASVEVHVENCPSCQRRAAAVSEDPLVELLRRAHIRNDNTAATFADAARASTPPPSARNTQTLAFHDTAIEFAERVPPDLAQHERYRVLRLL